MIAGFSHSRIALGDITLSVHRAGPRGTAGKGALILLHGFPQNHHAWAPVAPAFAEAFDVIIPDLRGYGESDAPPDDAQHTIYSKRRMAGDIVALMDALGIDRAHLLGHDRGARVAYRMGFDHPRRVDRIGVVEILPTADYWSGMNAHLAMRLYHWMFLAQPAPLPETLIGADPAYFLDHTVRSWSRAKSLDGFDPAALESYRAQMADPAHRHAMCADYRAGATTDRDHDEADLKAGRKLTAPLHLLWATSGFPASAGDPSSAWRRWAETVTTSSCESGHFVIEENPRAVLDSFLPFFTDRARA